MYQSSVENPKENQWLARDMRTRKPFLFADPRVYRLKTLKKSFMTGT